jgi:hypothetical protein
MRSFDYVRTPPEPRTGLDLVVAFFVVVIIGADLCASLKTASTALPAESHLAWLNRRPLLRDKRV